MRITALQSMDYSIRGRVLPLRAGADLDVSEDLAELLIERGFAELPSESEPAPEGPYVEAHDQDELEAFLAGTVEEVGAVIPDIEDVEDLDELEQREQAGKARKGVLEAIGARRAELLDE